MYWLTKPDESLADAIADYRREQLEAGLGFEGISRLRQFEDPHAFLEDCRLFEQEDTLPVKFLSPPHNLCVFTCRKKHWSVSSRCVTDSMKIC